MDFEEIKRMLQQIIIGVIIGLIIYAIGCIAYRIGYMY